MLETTNQPKVLIAQWSSRLSILARERGHGYPLVIRYRGSVLPATPRLHACMPFLNFLQQQNHITRQKSKQWETLGIHGLAEQQVIHISSLGGS